MLTLQNDPPTLDSGADDKDQYRGYGKTFRRMIAECLIKDPAKRYLAIPRSLLFSLGLGPFRPTATELLKHNFFKKSKDKKWLIHALIETGGSSHTVAQQVPVPSRPAHFAIAFFHCRRVFSYPHSYAASSLLGPCLSWEGPLSLSLPASLSSPSSGVARVAIGVRVRWRGGSGMGCRWRLGWEAGGAAVARGGILRRRSWRGTRAGGCRRSTRAWPSGSSTPAMRRTARRPGEPQPSTHLPIPTPHSPSPSCLPLPASGRVSILLLVPPIPGESNPPRGRIRSAFLTLLGSTLSFLPSPVSCMPPYWILPRAPRRLVTPLVGWFLVDGFWLMRLAGWVPPSASLCV